MAAAWNPKKSPVGSQDAFKKWSECGANTRSVNELKPPVFSQSERKIVALDLPAPASGIHGFFRFKVTSLSTSGKSVFAANIRAHPCLCWTGRRFMICVLTWIYQPSLWFWGPNRFLHLHVNPDRSVFPLAPRRVLRQTVAQLLAPHTCYTGPVNIHSREKVRSGGWK